MKTVPIIGGCLAIPLGVVIALKGIVMPGIVLVLIGIYTLMVVFIFHRRD